MSIKEETIPEKQHDNARIVPNPWIMQECKKYLLDNDNVGGLKSNQGC